MQKEKLTPDKIKIDLRGSAEAKKAKGIERYIYGFLSAALLSLVFFFALKMIWLGLASLSLTVYYAVRMCMIQRRKNSENKKIDDVDDKLDVSVSVEKLSHLSAETETTQVGGRTHYSEVYWLHFMSGVSWRIPNTLLYSYSKEYRLSSKGMKNIAVPGNEYYYVTMQGRYDMSFVYPCDFFELDESLNKKEEQ